MSFNKHWPRWIKASILKYVDTNKPLGAFVYYEGQERKTSEYSAWFEVRLDGPHALERSKDQWRLVVLLNVLISCSVDRDLYHVDRMVGELAQVLDATIPTFKFGDGVDDNPLISLGCLNLKTDSLRDGIVIHHYGQIEPKTKLLQATVEASYWIDL